MDPFISTVTENELIIQGFVQIPGGVDAAWVKPLPGLEPSHDEAVEPCIGLTYIRDEPEFALFSGDGAITYLKPQSWEQIDMLISMITGFEPILLTA